MYLPFPPLFLPVCWWLSYSCRCLLPLWDSQNVCTHCQKCISMTCKNPGHVVSQTKVCGTPGWSSLKPIKPQMCQQNPDETDSHCYFQPATLNCSTPPKEGGTANSLPVWCCYFLALPLVCVEMSSNINFIQIGTCNWNPIIVTISKL